MAAPYYTPSGSPATNAQGSSSDIRGEFSAIETAMDKLPTLTASYLIRVNAGGTALEPIDKVPVAQGGTGVSSLTDGGILLGSGTGAITSMAVLADGAMIVGDGTTDPVAESGTTLRTSIGLGTGDSVTFNGLTLTTDLSVANGGTGVSTLTDGGILLGSGTGAITAMAVLADGQMIVGDGTTDPVAESGATLRTSIGVGTGDTPTFTGLVVQGDKVTTDSISSTNTKLGVDAGDAIISGALSNTAFGNESLSSITTGDNCTAYGRYSLRQATGNNNTAFGAFAGDDLLSGENNLIFGHYSDTGSTTSTFRIIMGVSITGTANDQMSIGKPGSVVSNNFGTDAVWTRASDTRKKQDVNPLGLGLSFINDLEPVTYRWKTADQYPKEWNIDPKIEVDTDTIMTGMLAQRVKQALDNAGTGIRFPGWHELDNGMQQISGEAFIFPLINAINELTARLEKLEKTNLEDRL